VTSFREYRRLAAEGKTPDAEEITLPREVRPYQGRRAGIVSRTIANSIDFGVMVVSVAVGYLCWVGFWFLLNPTTFTWPTVNFGLLLLVGFGFLFCYFAIVWATVGRSYGDHLMGLRVVNFRGDRLRWGGAILRSAFCVAVPLGLFWVMVSRENRSLQDMVLRTSVIYDWQVNPNH
jgi:uncharacterized RDD family membrane protein YckC